MTGREREKERGGERKGAYGRKTERVCVRACVRAGVRVDRRMAECNFGFFMFIFMRLSLSLPFYLSLRSPPSPPLYLSPQHMSDGNSIHRGILCFSRT